MPCATLPEPEAGHQKNVLEFSKTLTIETMVCF
jgi:hypothetical protein